ncbi:MAG: RdgB/HAM1 family non-canonical purine NTP pyrophosphatase [Gemmatimonadetes bacterium]|nr:RdgB/HAM1 family non-canonical purine NTP pyrophosphatase [Gemmatimonadota bacterium]
MDLLLATGNRDKVKEIRAKLEGLPYNVRTLDEFPGAPEVVEDRDTLEGNAVKKAIEIAQFSGQLSLADDTGLFVPAIGGEPGVFSSRYAGEDVTYADNVNKLKDRMRDVPDGERGAYFECVIAIAYPDGVVGTASGRVDGVILREPRGKEGFGYDPLFFHEESGATFAELSVARKNEISHRALALDRAKKVLAGLARA